MSQEEFKRLLERIIREKFLDRNINVPIDYSWIITEPNDLFELTNITLEGEKSSRIVNIERLENRIETLENSYTKVLSDLQEIKGLLWKRESKKDEAILNYKENASKIEKVNSIFCKPTQEGVDFLIFVDSENISSTLRELIDLQINIENTYDEVLFDFVIEPLSDQKTDSSGWSPLYIKV